jgi:ATP-dependent exoDNAse (exonuclease V) alpha subunit
VHVKQIQQVNQVMYYLEVQPEKEERTVACLAYNRCFNNSKMKNFDEKMSSDSELIKEACTSYAHLGEFNLFDFGYCLTVHKSQGSEWDRVMLIDEGLPRQSKKDYYRWLYTGITRAKDKLIIVE